MTKEIEFIAQWYLNAGSDLDKKTYADMLIWSVWRASNRPKMYGNCPDPLVSMTAKAKALYDQRMQMEPPGIVTKAWFRQTDAVNILFANAFIDMPELQPSLIE